MALVELLQVSREAELIATPKPAPTTPEKAPKPGAAEEDRKDQQCDMTLESMHEPRANPPAKPRQAEAREAAEGNISNIPPHGALGGFALPTTTLVASTPTSSSGVGRLGDGGRGATKRWGEAVCVKERVPFVIGVGRGLCGKMEASMSSLSRNAEQACNR